MKGLRDVTTFNGGIIVRFRRADRMKIDDRRKTTPRLIQRCVVGKTDLTQGQPRGPLAAWPELPGLSMMPKKPAPDLIRGAKRFSDDIML